ncbi:hypothetical protein ACFOD4_00140 [Pseudoroseomonas globiformis]|uniref:Uncharacterized protein n=1 Tax=Teichococcus globiformis TaxID=2307229 RepID=A0ABV7FSY5_9PROT
MPLLYIHARNATFHSCDHGAEYEQPEVALALGIRGAVAMLAEDIAQGVQSSAVEISVEVEDGTQLLRSVVAFSVASMMPRGRLDHEQGR